MRLPVHHPPRPAGAPPARSGPIAATARALLIACVAFSLVWIPLARTAAGTVTGADVALFALWAIVAVDLLVHGVPDVDVDAPAMAILAIAVAALAALGAELSRADGRGVHEFMIFMKRFGLSAVIPIVARRFRSPAMGGRMRLLAVLSIAALVAFTLRPELRDYLPKPEYDGEANTSDRATGLGTNPNDLAFGAIALAVLYCAFLARRAGLLSRLVTAGVLAGTATCVVASGSRSGLLGGATALVFLVARSGIRRSAKIALTAGAGGAVALGLVLSPVFQERLGRLQRQGVQEQNLAGRMSAQWLAVRSSVRHPLGVGYRNIRWGTQSAHTGYVFDTTDSVYLDTLVGAGFAGLLALLLLFRSAWRHVAREERRGPGARILQAGLVAFFVFGSATVVPVSVFLAPLFFTVVAGASYVADDPG